MQAQEFVAFRLASVTSRDGSNKKKKYAHRSRLGCLTCRRRHVRCDEARPDCRRCVKARVGCNYADSTSQKSESTSDYPPAPLSIFKTSQEHDDLQFWLEVGAKDAGRWQSPVFYETILPRSSHIHECVRYSMLALSTCVHQWHLTDDDARAIVLARGSYYYSMSCRKVLESGDGRVSIEAALVSSLALFFYDSFTGNMKRRHVHSDAAISLLRLLKQGLSFNDVSGWRSESGKAGAQPIIEAAEEYFNDISYSTLKDCPKRKIEEADATPSDRKKLYAPVWLNLNKYPAAIEGTPAVFEIAPSPLTGWTTMQVEPDNVQSCHTYITLWHCWLFTWLINTTISITDLQRCRALCKRWHEWLFSTLQPDTTEMLSMRTRALILDELFVVQIFDGSQRSRRADVQPYLDRMLMLIESNIKLSNQVFSLESVGSSLYARERRARQYLRGLAKVVEFIVRRADGNVTRARARAIFTLQVHQQAQELVALGKAENRFGRYGQL